MSAPRIVRFVLALGCLMVIAAWSSLAQAATLHVANNGVDGPECGAAATPCRSISKAIALASDGDEIVVGPGHYGDLDDDGMFEPAAGEEAAQVGTGCHCMINVDKRLTIRSRAGSAATVLEAGGAAIHAVSITADEATFGTPTKGFTLTGVGSSARAGLAIASTTVGVKVQGCQAVGNAGRGFEAQGQGHILAGNLAMLNATGGFTVSCTECTVSGNVATANDGEGFAVDGSANTVRDNVAVRNGSNGFDIEGRGHVVRHNSAIANEAAGFLVFTSDLLITANNIFANAVAQPMQGRNLGLHNRSLAELTADGNYWGAATGPGADPADDVYSSMWGTADVAPFARKPFAVSPPARR
jgi:parallel beta-helix repeat protein